MSKKMIKRSLALGALMAFVITGNAMAAEYDNSSTSINGDAFATINGQDVTIKGADLVVSNSTLTVKDGQKLTIIGDGKTSGLGMIAESTINGNGYVVLHQTGDGVAISKGHGTYNKKYTYENNITASKIDIISDSTYAVKIDLQKDNKGATLNLDADDITIKATKKTGSAAAHGVYVTYTNQVNINDFNTLSVNLLNEVENDGGAAITSTQGGEVHIIGKNNGAIGNVTLSSVGQSAISAIGVKEDTKEATAKKYGNSNIEVKAKSLKLTSELYGTTEDEPRKNAVVGLKSVRDDFGSVVDLVIADELSIINNSKDKNATYAIDMYGKKTELNIAANKAKIDGFIRVGNGELDFSEINELVLVGLVAGNEKAAIQVDGGVLKINEKGTLAIDGAKAGDVYKVVSGVDENTVLWNDANLAYDRTTMIATSALDDKEKLYTVKYESFNDVENVTDEVKDQFVAAVGGEELAVPGLVAASTGQGSVMKDTAPGAKEFLAAVSSDEVMSKETKAAVINSAAKLAEAGGNAGTAASVASNVSNVTTSRMSFSGGNQGGHGVGLFEEGSGAAVWAQYMHGKDEATDMPMDGGATSYESEYDGIVVGVDFKKVGKFQSGIAFNYGEGDSNGFGSGIKTSSEYDFWGVGYYGNIRNEDTNFIFDVNYAKSDSDVTQDNPAASAAIEASPETTTWSAGVKVEKLYQNNNVQIVPYTGLRYMSIDTDEYQSNIGGDTLFNYAPERQDIWLLPLGVSIRQEVVNDNGWVVTPKVDLSYIWAFGDTDSNMSVSIPGIAASNDTLGFTVMDDGSFLGLVGVEAKLDDWIFGVSYSYQKGDYAESKKWYVDAKYSF